MAGSGRFYIGQHSAGDELPFLWWRLAGVFLVLAFLGWGFSTSLFCNPAPSRSQQLIFCLLLGLTLLETVQAGWYQSYDPLELTVLHYVKGVAKVILWILACVLLVLVLWVVISSMMELMGPMGSIGPIGLVYVAFVIALVVLLVLALGSDKGPGQ